MTPQYLARQEIEVRLEAHLKRLNERIITTRDENDAYEYTIRAQEIKWALRLFQDFSFMNAPQIEKT